MYTLFCGKKTPILSGKMENIGVCSCGLVDYDSRADRYVVVNPVDVIVLHAYTAVRNRIAAAEVIFGVGAGIAQAGVERVAGARVEAYNRTNRVSTGGPACLQLTVVTPTGVGVEAAPVPTIKLLVSFQLPLEPVNTFTC